MQEAGAPALMPLAAPIGTNKGLKTKEFIQILLDEIDIPIIIDAGIGTPAQACEAMQMGVDAMMINTAIANSNDIPLMAKAFGMAIKAGRIAYKAGLASTSNLARASSPLSDFVRD